MPLSYPLDNNAYADSKLVEANQYTDAREVAIKQWAYPVGAFYIQYPNANSNVDTDEFPVEQRPVSLFGGTWAEQWATESVYFRTRGTLSDNGRVNGKQEDALQGFRLQNVAQTGYRTSAGGGGNAHGLGDVPNYSTPLVTDTVNGTPRVASETRTVNRRIKVWKRTA